MACGATLAVKRAMALEPPSRSPKRRRYGPAPPLSSSSLLTTSSLSTSSSTSPSSRNGRGVPVTRGYLSVEASPFADVSPKVTAEELVASIRQEFRRLQRRKHLDTPTFVSPPSPSPPPSPLSEQMEAGSPPPPHADTGSVAPVSPPCPPRVSPVSPRRESPLLTLRQVALICERALRDRDESLRGEYENLLAAKLSVTHRDPDESLMGEYENLLTARLSEQYDAFVKFNHDQMLRRFGERPASYVS